MTRRERHEHKLAPKWAPEWFKRPVDRWWSKWMLTIPYAATGPAWDRIDRYQRNRWPLRYWLQKDLPMWFRIKKRQYDDAIRWVKLRVRRNYNVIKAPSLKPGYYDTDTLMFHANFDLLKEHVEEGLAHRGWTISEDTRLKNIKPKWLRTKLLYKLGAPEGSGISYLEWLINDPDLKVQAPGQAEWAGEVLDLYRWWTIERPARIEPYTDARIWGPKKKEERKKRRRIRRGTGSGLWGGSEDRRPGEYASRANEFYEEQDQRMLERLTAIRRCLWS